MYQLSAEDREFLTTRTFNLELHIRKIVVRIFYQTGTALYDIILAVHRIKALNLKCMIINQLDFQGIFSYQHYLAVIDLLVTAFKEKIIDKSVFEIRFANLFSQFLQADARVGLIKPDYDFRANLDLVFQSICQETILVDYLKRIFKSKLHARRAHKRSEKTSLYYYSFYDQNLISKQTIIEEIRPDFVVLEIDTHSRRGFHTIEQHARLQQMLIHTLQHNYTVKSARKE